MRVCAFLVELHHRLWDLRQFSGYESVLYERLLRRFRHNAKPSSVNAKPNSAIAKPNCDDIRLLPEHKLPFVFWL